MPDTAPADVLLLHDNAAAQPDMFWSFIVPLLMRFALLYFIAWRPQQREKKAHETMLASLAKDDAVVTTGGIHGRVLEVHGDVVVVEIAEKTRIRIDRAGVGRKVTPGANAPEPPK
jgi:preprotein translocase subunit YajC